MDLKSEKPAAPKTSLNQSCFLHPFVNENVHRLAVSSINDVSKSFVDEFLNSHHIDDTPSPEADDEKSIALISEQVTRAKCL